MQALQHSTFGAPAEVVELVDAPEPGDPGANEALVAVEYAPINNSDLLTIRGWYGVRPDLPSGAGNEGLGRVLAVGPGVDHLRVGDRVVISARRTTWRERILLPAAGLFALPLGADPQQLAMLSINPPTAALLLSEYVTLSPGAWVIQNAGNSGVGRSVIAFARERGLRTVSLVRSPALVDELLAAGGDVALAEGAEVAAAVAQATSNARMTLAIDGVGGESTRLLASSLAPGGLVAVYSAASGKPGLINPLDIIFRDVAMRGFWLDAPAFRQSPKVLEAIKTGARLIAEGKLHAPVAGAYPLTAAKEALTHAQKGGKVLFHIC